MESVSNMIRVSLPNYFSNLPVPSSIGGWFSLSGKTRKWVVLCQNSLFSCLMKVKFEVFLKNNES